nr:hypothetical protein [Tanacetum cinerariifolium]
MTLSGSGKEKLFKLKKVESFKARPDLNGKAINESQCKDIFIKPLDEPSFKRLIDELGIKRRHRDPSSDGVGDLVMTSRRDRIKEDLESSTWRRCSRKPAFVCDAIDMSRETRVRRKDTIGNEVVRVKIHKCMSWLDAYDEPIGDIDMMEDKIDNPSPQSTSQVLPSFKVYTPPVTYPKEVEETLGTPMEEETIKETQLKDLDLNTCKHDISFGSREVPIYDEP